MTPPSLKKHFNNQHIIKSSQGRSMVEMLGVLAIIGVLSVGGLAFYSRAMDKHLANKIANTISLAYSGAAEFYNKHSTQIAQYGIVRKNDMVKLGIIESQPTDGRYIETQWRGNNIFGVTYFVSSAPLTKRQCQFFLSNQVWDTIPLVQIRARPINLSDGIVFMYPDQYDLSLVQAGCDLKLSFLTFMFKLDSSISYVRDET